MQQVSFTYSIHYTSPSTLKPTLETHTCSGVYTTTTERVGFGYTVRSEITHSTVYRTRTILRLHSRTVTQSYGYAVVQSRSLKVVRLCSNKVLKS